MAEQETKKKKKGNAIVRAFATIPQWIERFFYRLGHYIVDYCKLFIIIPLLITVILLPGLMQMELLEDKPELWSLRGRKTLSNDTANNFQNSAATICQQIYRNDYGDIVTKEEGFLDSFYNESLPKVCSNAELAAEALNKDVTMENALMIMMFAKENPETGRKYSFTDKAITDVLFEIDMYLSFGLWVPDSQRMTAAVYTDFNSSLSSLCIKEIDGSCKQYSILAVSLHFCH